MENFIFCAVFVFPEDFGGTDSVGKNLAKP